VEVPPNPFLMELARDLARCAEQIAEAGAAAEKGEEYELAAKVLFDTLTGARGRGEARKIFARLAKRADLRTATWAKQQVLMEQVYRIKQERYPNDLPFPRTPITGPTTMAGLAGELAKDVALQRSYGLRGSRDPEVIKTRLNKLFNKWLEEQRRVLLA
jgi:hypothetical protein